MEITNYSLDGWINLKTHGYCLSLYIIHNTNESSFFVLMWGAIFLIKMYHSVDTYVFQDI